MNSSPKASPEQLAKLGALAAELVNDGDRVGLGSGHAARAFVRVLGARIAAGKVKAIGIATGILTEQIARAAKIPLASLHDVVAIDITIDGADEIDPALNLLKGGGGNLTREKVIATISKRLIIVAGEEKLVSRLGTRFPVFVEVIEFARPVVTRSITALGARVQQRKNSDGSAFLTDNNNPYLECWFNHEGGGPALTAPAALDAAIRGLPGVVESGLFIQMASEALIARCDNTVQRLTR